jgi:hypothetical protein
MIITPNFPHPASSTSKYQTANTLQNIAVRSAAPQAAKSNVLIPAF